MNELFIYTHMGGGDHILTNGLINHISESYDRVTTFAKPANIKNVLRLYAGTNVRVIQMDDREARSFLTFHPDNQLIVGHTPEYFNKLRVNEYTFEEGFYKMAEVPFEYKWSKFKYPQNSFYENEMWKTLNFASTEEFIFVHDDPKRERVFKEKLLPKNIRRIRPVDFPNISIFDFIPLIKIAKEVHTHNSSFSNLIDTLELQHPALFYHRYARTDCGDQTFSKNVKWNFIN